MLGPVITLVTLALSLAWAIFLRGGVYPSDWVSTVLFVGGIVLVYATFVRRRSIAPSLPPWMTIVLAVLPAYIAFQLLPLPLPLLRMLSPARAQLVDALTPVVGAIAKAPLSVNPPMATMWAFSFLCYIAVFLLVRELSWRFAEKPWAVVLPLIILASFQALLGLYQVWTGWPSAEATGTYTNRDHFSGLLEMVLPFAVVYGWSALQNRHHEIDESLHWPVVMACVSWIAAAMMLVAIMYSLSRMGFFDILCALFVIAALSFGPRLPSQNFRMILLTVLALGVLGLFVFLPPDQLLERFADMSAAGKITADTRLSFWKSTLALIGEFRWFGCGLGGFESTFLKYQTVSNGFRVEMAHNDYLQYLAELGLIGFGILVAAIVGVIAPLAKAIAKNEDENRRLVLVACAGSFVAIGLHSLVDFNLYIPANAMTLAWIAGVASRNAQEAV